MRDHEPQVWQRARLMGHPLSPRHDDLAFPCDAAPSPSLETTDALRWRRPSWGGRYEGTTEFLGRGRPRARTPRRGAWASIGVGRCANGRTPDLETKTALKENATGCSTERSGDDRHRREKI